MSQETEQPAPPPHVQVIQMATGYWVSRIIYAAAKLDLADRLAGGPKSAAELAGPTETHAPSLHRLMRALAALGLLTGKDGKRFALTPLGETLKTGAPGSARATVLTLGGPFGWKAWEELLHSVKTGKTGFEKAFGMGAFDYLAKHPDEASLFSETMIGVHGEEPATVAEAYDFSKHQVVADIGGASGSMLAAILTRHKAPKGLLFDLPHVVRDAPAILKARGIVDRVRIESGSFFETVPSGADCYFLSHIIHDWSEAQCLTILGHCRKAVPAGGRLLICEMVLPPGDAFHPGKILDITMLVMPGGQERTPEEYADLLGKARFRMERVIPTASAVSLVEAVPV
ncbi:MAG TPA: methyltransferase [Verrucomicrobiae bacterium]|nr:methyltransferase [Verrucomicrobiae bacterium]